MTQPEDSFDLDALDYPAAPYEDGSAPRGEYALRTRRTKVWHDVACGRCKSPLEPVMNDTMDSEGTWSNLQAKGALLLNLKGGFGMYVDSMEGWSGRETDAAVLLCEECATWLRSEIPGVEMVIQRLDRS